MQSLGVYSPSHFHSARHPTLTKLFTDFPEKALDEDMATNSNKQPVKENGEPVGSKAIQSLDEIFDNHNRTSLGALDERRADHVNFRHLLWKAMASFPEVAEQKSRDVVPLFLRFVR